ncbi:MAG: hypothetical protein WKG06_37480 [Segetibacter sp.]
MTKKVLQLINQKVVAINFIIEIELLGWRLMNPELQTVILDLIKDVHYFDYSHRVKQREQLYLGKSTILNWQIEFDFTLVSAEQNIL